MQRHAVTANGLTLAVSDLGRGPAVLFCHGFPAVGASWLRQMEAVAAAGFRALAPDMRGYGDSDAPEGAEAYTPFHTVGDLVAILDHFGLADCVLVGHDFGASAAWYAAMMRPDRFRAVFGMSVAFRRLGGPSFLERLRAAGRDDFYMFAQMRPEADTAWVDAATTIPAFYYRSSGESPPAERWHAFDAGSMTRPAPNPATIDPAYLAQAVDAFARRGFHGPLNSYRALDRFFAVASGPYAGATIAQPSHFLTGALDGLRPFHPDEAVLREGLTDLRGITLLEGIGHWPQLEAPEAVNRSLLAFLAETAR
jgi:pimeloyl-ACP methyl ester carboxylesterase